MLLHMGLFNALSALTSKLGSSAPRLAQVGGNAPLVDVAKLSVSTAESLIIVVTDPVGAEVIRTIAESGEAATLRSAEATVYFKVSAKRELPVHDPRKGWAIPLDPELREQITTAITGPGEFELTDVLAIVVEEN